MARQEHQQAQNERKNARARTHEQHTPNTSTSTVTSAQPTREIMAIKFYGFYYCDAEIILNKDTFLFHLAFVSLFQSFDFTRYAWMDFNGYGDTHLCMCVCVYNLNVATRSLSLLL